MVKFVSGVVFFFLLTIACSILLSMATTLAPEALQERGKKTGRKFTVQKTSESSQSQTVNTCNTSGPPPGQWNRKLCNNRKENCSLCCYLFFFFSFFPFSTSKIQLIALRESLLCSPVVSWGQSVRGSGGSDMLLKVQINGSREKKKHSWVHTVQGGFGHYYD